MYTFYNTLTQKKEPFIQERDTPVRMYNCGPTVYDDVHIGNLRAFLLADILRRALTYGGYEVKQVMNITDEDDKIEQRAQEERKSVQEIASLYEKVFFQNLDSLHILKAEVYPRATDHIQEQIALIEKLEAKGYTYELPEGIYFDTAMFTKYGELAHLDEKGLREGARVDQIKNKKNLTDFVLWKFPLDKPRQRISESPWGKGSPGWHIECSAMAMKHLGETLDIHTGGIDLIPTHHTNEKAQSESATGVPFSRFWIHNAYVNVDSGKMAKSEGTGITLLDVVKNGYHPLAFRYFLLSAHYRSPINFSWDALSSAQAGFQKLHKFFNEWEGVGSAPHTQINTFRKVIQDDLGTPQALALLFEVAKDTTLSAGEKRAFFLETDKVLGLGFDLSSNERARFVPQKITPYLEVDTIPIAIQNIMHERVIARRNKKWERADELRNEAFELGYSIDDTEKGQRVYKLSRP